MGSCGCSKPKCTGGCTPKTTVTVTQWSCGDAVSAGSLVMHNCLLYLALEDHPLGDKEAPTTSDHFTKALSLAKAIELIALGASTSHIVVASGAFDPATDLLTLTLSDATTVAIDLSAIATSAGHALLAGDASQIFEVNTAIAATDATNLGQVTALIAAAIAAIPMDVHVNGWTGYDAVTNMLEITLSDGATHAIDLTGLLADAAASANHADLNGNIAQVFSVDTAVAGTDAVNLTQMTAAIAAAVLAATVGAGHAWLNGSPTELFEVADAVGAFDAVNLQSLNAALIATGHALLAGDDTQIFEVADHAGNPFEAVNYQMLQNEIALSNHAQLNGDNTEVFEVADATMGSEAINYQQLTAPVPWITPAIAAPYEVYTGTGSGAYTELRYSKSLDGMVTIVGFVQKQDMTTGIDTLFTLPVGYRPKGMVQVIAAVGPIGEVIYRIGAAGSVMLRSDSGWQGGDPTFYVSMALTFQGGN